MRQMRNVFAVTDQLSVCIETTSWIESSYVNITLIHRA